MSVPHSSLEAPAARQVSYGRAWDPDAIEAVRKWCHEHAGRVLAAYAAGFQEHPRAFIVTRSGSYDFDLSDDLSKLESELWDTGFECELLQVPNASESELLHFFDPHTSISIYVQPE